MPPKENTSVLDNPRFLQVEQAILQHEEGFDRITQQCADLKSGMERIEEQHSREFTQLTAAMAKMGDTLASIVIKGDSLHLKVVAPPHHNNRDEPVPHCRLNPSATSLLGTSPDPVNITIPTETPSLPKVANFMPQDPTFKPQASSFMHKLPRVDFPKFNGGQVRNWIQKVQRFFLLHPMEDHQKVLYSSLNFSDAAEIWFQTDAAKFAALSWSEFATLVQNRFSEELSENVIGEFKLLYQKGSILEYQQQFEQLRPLVLLQNPGLSEKYFVDSCIAGLREDIRHSVQMFYPSTVQSVFALARLQEV
ncbi:hypothetical protein ACHQM5_017757 [Ranunculus cassubicifolius]